MSGAVANNLTLIRRTCAAIGARTTDAAILPSLGMIDLLLGDLIATIEAVPTIEAATAAKLGASNFAEGMLRAALKIRADADTMVPRLSPISADFTLRTPAQAGVQPSTGRLLDPRLRGGTDLVFPKAAAGNADVSAYELSPGSDLAIAIERAHLAAVDAAVQTEIARAPTVAATPEAATDLDALTRFLRDTFPDEREVAVTAAETVSRGMSKKTILLTLADAATLPAALALRMDQSATNYLGTTVTEEYAPVRGLSQHGARVPRPYALEPTGTLLGEPFLLSEKVTGTSIGGNYSYPPRNPALMADIAACLAGIHRVPVDALGLDAGAGGLDAEIAQSWADWLELGIASPVIEAGFGWVRAHRALGDGPPVPVHNDFNFNNLLVDGDRVTAVVDWEFVHIGAAAADLGYIYYGAEHVAGFDAFLAAYAAAGGRLPAPATLAFYILWGQIRLGVLACLGAQSADTGTSADARFGIARQHRRLAIRRVGDLLAALDAGGPEHLIDHLRKGAQ